MLKQYSNYFWSGFSCVVTHIGFGCFQVNQLITVAAVIYTDFLLAGTVPGIPIPTAITDAYNALLLDRPVCSSKKKQPHLRAESNATQKMHIVRLTHKVFHVKLMSVATKTKSTFLRALVYMLAYFKNLLFQGLFYFGSNKGKKVKSSIIECNISRTVHYEADA